MREEKSPSAPQFSDAELDERRRALEGRIAEERAEIVRNDQKHYAGQADAQSMGSIFKLSSEFVGGVFAGGVLGWIIDHFAGTSPWGLIVCTLLGFGAGILNMMRAVGLVRSWGDTEKKDLGK